MIYSRRLWIATLTTTSETLYIAPAGDTVVLRDLEISGDLSAGTLIFVSLNVSGSGGVPLVFTALGGWQLFQWKGRAVLQSGDTVTGNTTTGTAQSYASGYVLT